MESSDITRLTRENAAETLLLHKEAVRLAEKKPLEILRRHNGDVSMVVNRREHPGRLRFQNCKEHVI